MKAMYKLLLLALLMADYQAAAHGEVLCGDNEIIVFNCEFAKKTASLCQSQHSGSLSYRSGVMGRVDLEVVSAANQRHDVFYFSNTSYAGGGEAHIKFSRNNYTYFLYDKTVKTDGGPTFSAGIVVFRGQRRVSNLRCNNDASIHRSAYESMTKEAYRDIQTR